jgi:hypothetical protein
MAIKAISRMEDANNWWWSIAQKIQFFGMRLISLCGGSGSEKSGLLHETGINIAQLVK